MKVLAVLLFVVGLLFKTFCACGTYAIPLAERMSSSCRLLNHMQSIWTVSQFEVWRTRFGLCYMVLAHASKTPHLARVFYHSGHLE